MLTLRQLLKATPKVVFQRGSSSKVLTTKVSSDKNGIRTLRVTMRRTIGGKPHPVHKCNVVTIAPDMGFSEGYVKVGCDCGFFTYYGLEWVLHRHGAADIFYSNGEPPDIRNPRYRVMLCPHLVKLAEVLVRKRL